MPRGPPKAGKGIIAPDIYQIYINVKLNHKRRCKLVVIPRHVKPVFQSNNSDALGRKRYTVVHTEVSEQLKENGLSCGNDEARQLTPEPERQLADSFAFISASTDDMLMVMAVCVEEDPDKMGMTIRLASNTGDLSRITEDFNGIANTVEKAALKGMTGLAQDKGFY